MPLGSQQEIEGRKTKSALKMSLPRLKGPSCKWTNTWEKRKEEGNALEGHVGTGNRPPCPRGHHLCPVGQALCWALAISSKRRQKRRKTRRADTLGRETGRNKEALIIQREREVSKNDVHTVKSQEEEDERGEAGEIKIGSPVRQASGGETAGGRGADGELGGGGWG